MICSIKHLKHLSFLVALCVLPNRAQAFINAHGTYGFENNTASGGRIGSGDISLSGNTPTLAVYLDPIPLVPVAFGVSVAMPSLTGKDSAKNDMTLTGMVTDLQVMAWSPIGLLGIKPYAKLGYILGLAYAVEHKIKNRVNLGGNDIDPAVVGQRNYTYALETSGYQLAVGLKYSLIPFVGLLAEFSMRRETAKAADIKVSGQKVSLNLGELKMAANTFLVGVEVGI